MGSGMSACMFSSSVSSQRMEGGLRPHRLQISILDTLHETQVVLRHVNEML
jgi:hypothetical protein